MNYQQKELLLWVKDLKTHFFTRKGIVRAVDGVDLDIGPGEILGLVGESGCGKSVTAHSIMRLLDPPGRTIEGQVFFLGQDILKLSEREMVRIRGEHISMIFQQPKSSLNPLQTVGKQIAEVFEVHRDMDKRIAQDNAVEILQSVGIPDPVEKARAYPHELSGGQAQRVMIAMALALMPQVLIADEPTTALDVTIQAQILDLMRELQSKMGTAIILITHDLGLIAEMANRVTVMYAGCIVESANVYALFENPLHPYTKGLIGCVPILGMVTEDLPTIPGNVPDLIELPTGCRFSPRCEARDRYKIDLCTTSEPDLVQFQPGHSVRCWLYQDHEGHVAPPRPNHPIS